MRWIKIEVNNLESSRYSWNAMENRWYWKKILISLCMKKLWDYWKQEKQCVSERDDNNIIN